MRTLVSAFIVIEQKTPFASRFLSLLREDLCRLESACVDYFSPVVADLALGEDSEESQKKLYDICSGLLDARILGVQTGKLQNFHPQEFQKPNKNTAPLLFLFLPYQTIGETEERRRLYVRLAKIAPSFAGIILFAISDSKTDIEFTDDSLMRETAQDFSDLTSECWLRVVAVSGRRRFDGSITLEEELTRALAAIVAQDLFYESEYDGIVRLSPFNGFAFETFSSSVLSIDRNTIETTISSLYRKELFSRVLKEMGQIETASNAMLEESPSEMLVKVCDKLGTIVPRAQRPVCFKTMSDEPLSVIFNLPQESIELTSSREAPVVEKRLNALMKARQDFMTSLRASFVERLSARSLKECKLLKEMCLQLVMQRKCFDRNDTFLRVLKERYLFSKINDTVSTKKEESDSESNSDNTVENVINTENKGELSSSNRSYETTSAIDSALTLLREIKFSKVMSIVICTFLLIAIVGLNVFDIPTTIKAAGSGIGLVAFFVTIITTISKQKDKIEAANVLIRETLKGNAEQLLESSVEFIINSCRRAFEAVSPLLIMRNGKGKSAPQNLDLGTASELMVESLNALEERLNIDATMPKAEPANMFEPNKYPLLLDYLRKDPNFGRETDHSEFKAEILARFKLFLSDTTDRSPLQLGDLFRVDLLRRARNVLHNRNIMFFLRTEFSSTNVNSSEVLTRILPKDGNMYARGAFIQKVLNSSEFDIEEGYSRPRNYLFIPNEQDSIFRNFESSDFKQKESVIPDVCFTAKFLELYTGLPDVAEQESDIDVDEKKRAYFEK